MIETTYSLEPLVDAKGGSAGYIYCTQSSGCNQITRGYATMSETD